LATQRCSARPHSIETLVAGVTSGEIADKRAAEASHAEKLGRYPAYKSARVHWLDEIPAHWQEKRGKYFFREIDERSVTGEEELLSVSHTTGVTPRSQKNVTMFKAESYVGHKVAKPKDIVINTMWAWMAAVGVANHVGIISPSYGVYRPLNDKDYLPAFVDYLLRIPPLKWEYICRSTGIRASRLRLYPDKFLDIALPCPPREEQERMLAYLRAYDVKYRLLIRHKRRLIELAEERLNVTTEEVCRSSDVVQDRLEVATYLADRHVERKKSDVYTPIGLYNRGRGVFHKPRAAGDELGASTFFWIEEGDLILSGQFAWEGAVAIAGPEDTGCIASHRYPILRGKPDVTNSAFLFAFFRTQYGQLLLDYHSRGAAGRNRPLNVRTLRKEKIPIPSLNAQEPLERFVNLLASLRKRFRSEVEVLREYRERLIADVVTGKLDLRHVEILAPAEEQIDESEELEAEEETADDEVMEEADANG
jgi:type I restriction enzyme S subunit